MQLAPWLRPTDTLGAIRSGASLGLQMRQQAAQEEQAAAALRQREDELFAQNERAKESMDARKSEAAASLAQAAAQRALMAGHYSDDKAIRTAANDLRDREVKLQEKQAQRFSVDGPVMASDIVDAEGNVLGKGVRGAHGGFHTLSPGKGEKIPATPSAIASLTRGATAELATTTDPQRVAELQAIVKQGNDAARALTLPGFRPPVAQVTPVSGPTFGFRKPTTNWVDAPVVSPTNAPASALDSEVANAYEAIDKGRNATDIKAKFKARTGKDLPWPPQK